MAETRMMESGYKRRHLPVCDRCGSNDLNYSIKNWVKCDNCGRLYSKKHKFDRVVE